MGTVRYKIPIVVFFVAVLLFFVPACSASTLYFYPIRKAIPLGQAQQVQLRLDTNGEQVNAFSAFITYPANLIDVSLVGGSDAFSIVAEQSVSAGMIKLTRGSVAPVTGDVLLETLSVSGIHVGEAKMVFANGSAAPRFSDSSDSLSLSRSIGGYYTVTGYKSKISKGEEINTWETKQPVIWRLLQMLQKLK